MKTIRINSKASHKISPYLYMQFMEPLGTADTSVDAAWDFVKQEWRPEVLELVKQLAPPMVRWGGCFASYYHWQEAVGKLEDRVPMLNLAWDGLYANQVGTAELVQFCQMIDAELLLTVNMESDGRMHWAYPRPDQDRLGTAAEAADWIRYCNDPDNALRKAHGVKEPYNVTYWQIGNETSYDPNGFNEEEAVARTKKFAQAMRAADPDIKLIAWGDDGWAKAMVDECGDLIDYVSFHHHFDSGLPESPLYGNEYRRDFARTWQHLMHAHKSLQAHIDRVREQVKGSDVRITMTEGHFSLPGRNRCELLSSWAAGVAYARCLNIIERNSDIIDIATMADFFGNRWQVNAMMIPTPFRKNSKPYLQPVGRVMQLYNRYHGQYQLTVDGPADLDITGSIKEDTIYLHVANTNINQAVKVDLAVDGRQVLETQVHEIALNPEFEITELTPDAMQPVSYSWREQEWSFPPASVSAVVIKLKAADKI